MEHDCRPDFKRVASLPKPHGLYNRFHVAFEQHFSMKTQAITGKNTDLISKFDRDLCVCCLTGTLHRNNRLKCYSHDRKRRLPHHKQKTLTGIAMNKKYQKSDLKKQQHKPAFFPDSWSAHADHWNQNDTSVHMDFHSPAWSSVMWRRMFLHRSRLFLLEYFIGQSPTNLKTEQPMNGNPNRVSVLHLKHDSMDSRRI